MSTRKQPKSFKNKPFHPKLQKKIISKLEDLWISYEVAISVGDESQHDMLDFVKYVADNIEAKTIENIIRVRPQSERG